MENTNDNQNWQLAENQDNEQRALNSETENNWDFRQAEAGGYQSDNDPEKRFANDRDDEEDDDDENEDDDTENDSPKRDWGSVDPQEHPGIPSDMDPSGPGSAV